MHNVKGMARARVESVLDGLQDHEEQHAWLTSEVKTSATSALARVGRGEIVTLSKLVRVLAEAHIGHHVRHQNRA